jgi:hypothetical protein
MPRVVTHIIRELRCIFTLSQVTARVERETRQRPENIVVAWLRY